MGPTKREISCASLNLLYTNLKINLVTILTCDRLTSPVFTSLDWTVILCGLNVEGRLLERLLSKKSRKKSQREEISTYFFYFLCCTLTFLDC